MVEQKPNVDLEISRAPPTPDPSTIPEVLEIQGLSSAAVAAVSAAPGLAVREWPVEKRSTPPVAPAQVFVPKKTQPNESETPQSAAASKPTSPPPAAPVQSPPTPATASAPAPASSTPQPAALRKSAEQNVAEKDSQNVVPSSPSLTSEGLRNPTYADIALGMPTTPLDISHTSLIYHTIKQYRKQTYTNFNNRSCTHQQSTHLKWQIAIHSSLLSLTANHLLLRGTPCTSLHRPRGQAPVSNPRLSFFPSPILLEIFSLPIYHLQPTIFYWNDPVHASPRLSFLLSVLLPPPFSFHSSPLRHPPSANEKRPIPFISL